MKIIFKYVNSTVWFSFKVLFLIKYLWVPWIVHETHWKNIILLSLPVWDPQCTWNALLKKKKKERIRKLETQTQYFSALSKRRLMQINGNFECVSPLYDTHFRIFFKKNFIFHNAHKIFETLSQCILNHLNPLLYQL